MALEYIKSLRFIKSLKSISDEWLNVIFWSSPLFGIFMIKKCVEFSLKSFDTKCWV